MIRYYQTYSLLNLSPQISRGVTRFPFAGLSTMFPMSVLFSEPISLITCLRSFNYIFLILEISAVLVGIFFEDYFVG